ncbi:MAG: hypothetical protein WA001_03780 [Patescibacteria group bacterium]
MSWWWWRPDEQIDRIEVSIMDLAEAVANATREVGETRTQNEAIKAMLVAFRARVEELLAAGGGATAEQIQALANELDATQADVQTELDRPVP